MAKSLSKASPASPFKHMTFAAVAEIAQPIRQGELGAAIVILQLQSFIASCFSLFFGSYPLIIIAWLIGVPGILAAAHAGRSHFASRVLQCLLIAILVAAVMEGYSHWIVVYGWHLHLFVSPRILSSVALLLAWTFLMLRYRFEFGYLFKTGISRFLDWPGSCCVSVLILLNVLAVVSFLTTIAPTTLPTTAPCIILLALPITVMVIVRSDSVVLKMAAVSTLAAYMISSTCMCYAWLNPTNFQIFLERGPIMVIFPSFLIVWGMIGLTLEIGSFGKKQFPRYSLWFMLQLSSSVALALAVSLPGLRLGTLTFIASFQVVTIVCASLGIVTSWTQATDGTRSIQWWAYSTAIVLIAGLAIFIRSHSLQTGDYEPSPNVDNTARDVREQESAVADTAAPKSADPLRPFQTEPQM